MRLGTQLGLGLLAVCVAAACDGGGEADGGGVLPDGASPPDGSAGTDGGTPGPFIPVAVLIGGDRGQRKLFAIDLELTQEVEISHESAYVGTDTESAFILDVAPDGRHVAYASSDSTPGVYVAPTDRSGGAVQVGEGTATRVVWAPDGSRLLYLQYDGGWGPLFSVLPDGTGSVMLADSVELFEWSPDSQRVLYVTSDDTGAGAPSEAFVVAADGTGQVDLVAALATAAGVTHLSRGLDFERPVAWSPDGARIAICGAWPVGGTTSSFHSNIYLVDPDGTNVTQLVGATGPTDPIYTGRDVRWAPDGSRLAFWVAPRLTAPVLHTILPDGTGEATTDAGGFRLAGWSPDSSHVAMTAGGALRAAPADTLVSMELASLTGEFFRPGGAQFAWSPDSASIAYHSDADGAMELFVAAADGTNPTKVSMPLDAGDSVGGFRWFGDGTYLTHTTQSTIHVVPAPSSVAPQPVDLTGVEWDALGDHVATTLSARGCVPRTGGNIYDWTEIGFGSCTLYPVECMPAGEEPYSLVIMLCSFRMPPTRRMFITDGDYDITELRGVNTVGWR